MYSQSWSSELELACVAFNLTSLQSVFIDRDLLDD